MANHHPPSCSAGGLVPSSRDTLQPADDAPRCSSCNAVIISIVSIQAGRCAVCRAELRACMSLEELEHVAEEFELQAARRRTIGAFSAAGDFEAEARLVRAVVTARREDLSNA